MIYQGLATFCLVAALLVVIAGMLGLHRAGSIAADEWAAERAFLDAEGISMAKLCVGPNDEWLRGGCGRACLWPDPDGDYMAGVAELGDENTVYCDARGRA